MVDKRKSAAAIKYDANIDNAPRLIAKGKGAVAERILELADELKIPVHRDPDLIEVLGKLNLNEEVPPEVYAVIARILSFVYKLNNKATGKK